MKRVIGAVALLFAAAAAHGWPSCDARDLQAPVPVQHEAPAYPPAVRASGVEGWVEIAFTVLRDGRVGWTQVLRAEPAGYFEQAAANGVRGWRFEPARQGGEAIECRFRTRMRFTLVDAVATPGAHFDAMGGPVPTYPAALLAARVEGYAEVEFELDAAGAVANARVINAMPRGEFEAAALAAVRGWKPDASLLAAAGGQRLTRRFEFRLPDTSLTSVPATTFASAPFPIEACKRRLSGRVALEVETDTSGSVKSARVLSAEPTGLFDASALAIARGSRLSPAWRDGLPVGATALVTLFFDPAKVTCPGTQVPDPKRPAGNRVQPRVSRNDERPAACAGPWPGLCPLPAGQLR